jgi:hypothetical protein
MIKAFIRFFFSRNLKNWRELRRQCRDELPKKDRELA